MSQPAAGLRWVATDADTMTDDTNDTAETRRTISESADKIVLKTNVKRGSGTRDQDKIDVKVKGDDPETTVHKLGRVLDELDDANIAVALRTTQPEGDE